jgi:hypothetical protein
MANKRNEVPVDPAAARTATATNENLVTAPEQQDGESDRDYLKRRSEQARREAQEKPAPVVTESLPGAAQDLAGRGKPIGAGKEFTRGGEGSSGR